LKKGGNVVYHGPIGQDSQTIIKYFEGNGAPKCPKRKNPAEYILEAIGAGDPNRKERDWGEVWRESPEHRIRDEEIETFIRERSGGASSTAMADNRQFAMPISSQIAAVMKRTFVSYWRCPQYAVGMMMLHIFCGLFNSFTFYKLGSSTIDMQSRLFSIFMTLTISPPLIQQLQPKFLEIRDLFTARENNSRIYHWSVWVISAIVVELPYRIVAGTLYFICWYWPVKFPRDSSAAGYTWLMMMLFELYYLGFGQLIASFSPNELLASLLVPVFFIFIVSFCGVVVPYIAIPTFWRKWMYWVSPFTYIFEGWLGVLTHDVKVRCTNSEFALFTPPDGMTCANYVSAFLKKSGGYVEESNGECRFCQYATGEEFSRSFHATYDHRWRNIGIIVGFVMFNFVFVFVCTWFYMGGAKRLMKKWRKA